MKNFSSLSRREFLASTSVLLAGATLPLRADEPAEPIIDIHQHTAYGGRADQQLLAHQRAMGITHTILLPAGREVKSASRHDGVSNGLQAKCTGNEACMKFAQDHPKEFLFGANEV